MIDTMDYKEMALMNVTSYDNFEEYLNNNNMDCEEFEYNIDNGYIQEITLGVYNGATDTFTKRGITENHIIDAMLTELSDANDSFIYYMEEVGKEENADINTFSDERLVYEYSIFNSVVTIGNSIYVEQQ